MKIAIIGAGRIHHDVADMRTIAEQTRAAAYAIIARTGATHYAIAAGLLRIVEAIVRDERSVLTVSTLVEGYDGIDDVYLSIPVVLGSGGVERRLRAPLSPDELAALQRSARVLRTARARLQPDVLPPSRRAAEDES